MRKFNIGHKLRAIKNPSAITEVVAVNDTEMYCKFGYGIDKLNCPEDWERISAMDSPVGTWLKFNWDSYSVIAVLTETRKGHYRGYSETWHIAPLAENDKEFWVVMTPEEIAEAIEKYGNPVVPFKPGDMIQLNGIGEFCEFIKDTGDGHFEYKTSGGLSYVTITPYKDWQPAKFDLYNHGRTKLWVRGTGSVIGVLTNKAQGYVYDPKCGWYATTLMQGNAEKWTLMPYSEIAKNIEKYGDPTQPKLSKGDYATYKDQVIHLDYIGISGLSADATNSKGEYVLAVLAECKKLEMKWPFFEGAQMRSCNRRPEILTQNKQLNGGCSSCKLVPFKEVKELLIKKYIPEQGDFKVGDIIHFMDLKYKVTKVCPNNTQFNYRYLIDVEGIEGNTRNYAGQNPAQFKIYISPEERVARALYAHQGGSHWDDPTYNTAKSKFIEQAQVAIAAMKG